MSEDETPRNGASAPGDCARAVRADAQRNLVLLLTAAAEVFAVSGVDAPARQIADRAGVGVGTLYRHFPKRSDLVAAVFRSEVDECAAAASELAKSHADDPLRALVAWLHRYVDFIVTKRGLAAALHSGDSAFSGLHDYFDRRLDPALNSLLEAAVDAGEVRADIPPHILLHAVRSVCLPDDDGSVNHIRPVVDLLVDGLRFGARRPADPTARARYQS